MNRPDPPSRAAYGTVGKPSATRGTSARRTRGAALILGAVLIVALTEFGTMPRYWFPTLVGLTQIRE